MHNAALAALNEPRLAGLRYFKFEIAPEALGDALALFRQKNFIGLNLTLPHKVVALAHVTRLSEIAAAAGAANTLVPDGNGFAGHNTDGTGFLLALREEFGIATLTGKTLVLLGAGGAARGIAAAALAATAAEAATTATATAEAATATIPPAPPTQIFLVNRNRDRLAATLAALQKSFPAAADKLHAFAPTDANLWRDLPAAAIIANATSLGLQPADPSPAPSEIWRENLLAYDIVCGVPETQFLRDARAAKTPAADGFSMLAHQGALALATWTNTPPQPAIMLQTLRP
jgi:shikimate dehydrogenase